ncbi:phosphoglycerate kinase [Roseiterribacter gracilis]|uniref:Phosphoglycerate kinase n=1 Tax=Roseiterribacter gracilis TaxID=2812848 RepID=A0A8S8XCD5_9PROT|nr:phosphoglycerate kinase [Rhodospirillales bacterium TMPK1]
MAGVRTLDTAELRGNIALVRADLNVPMQDGKVTDTARIDQLKATVDRLITGGAKVVLLSHFGRPKGGPDAKYSLHQIVPTLGERLGRTIRFASDCVGPVAHEAVESLANGEVLLLENLRFHAEEEANDWNFAELLSELGDIYVNDAFSIAHRAHASVEALARLMPSYAGIAMQRELEALDAALENPKRPVMALVGGAKISTKLELLGNLVRKVDALALGGGMANTFLAATGKAIGKSLVEKDMLDEARRIADIAAKAGCDLILPVDAVVAREFKANAANETVSVDAVPDDAMILDVGPDSIEALNQRLASVNTVLWNGPLGAFELTPFDRGTVEVAKAVAARTEKGHLTSIAGGGDTSAAMAHAGVETRFTYISTAGGAFLEWLEGKVLPGVAVLSGDATKQPNAAD